MSRSTASFFSLKRGRDLVRPEVKYFDLTTGERGMLPQNGFRAVASLSSLSVGMIEAERGVGRGVRSESIP